MKNGTSLDEIDVKILKLLQSDAKLTAKNIGDRIGLSQTPVYERVKKLERNGIIKRYVALVEPELLDKSLVVLMNITIQEHKIGSRESFVKSITELPQVVELYHTSGRFDFIAKVRVSKVSEYRDFLLDKITPIENVKDIDSHIVLEELKYTTSIDL